MAGFLLLFGFSFFITGRFFQPKWTGWSNYDSAYGFYEEPENTIETIFLGASITANGISPMNLYEDYGICSYNLGMESQPMAASYYWMEEAYRFHNESLKTIVLDASILRRGRNEEAFRRSIDGMRISSVKLHALLDYYEDYNTVLSYVFPLFEYHNRWTNINRDDFTKQEYEAKLFLRGYNFSTAKYFDAGDYNALAVPVYYPADTENYTEFDNDGLFYLDKMIRFCNEKGLRFILFKTPGTNAWGDADHNAASQLATVNHIEFYDFNYEPYISQIRYNHALDNADGSHMNYYGAVKLTRWMGRFLKVFCDATDVRANEKYTFMNEELRAFHEYVDPILHYQAFGDVTEYMDYALHNTNNVVFLTVKYDAATALSEKQRDYFKWIGCEQLSGIQENDSYIGMIENGTVIYEEIDAMADHPEEWTFEAPFKEDEAFEANHLQGRMLEDQDNKESFLHKKGMMDDSTTYDVKSGGRYLGNIASCVINGGEASMNGSGINIIVYDRRTKAVADSAVFSTNADTIQAARNLEAEMDQALSGGVAPENMPTNLNKLYNYNERCKSARAAAIDRKRQKAAEEAGQ